MQVAATLTPSSAPVVAGALIWAYQQVTGRPPPARTSWTYALGQSADETAHWTAMRMWNVGFITSTSSQPYFVLGGSNQLHFAAYGSLGDGCVAMMRWLNAHGSLAAADAGDFAGYIAGLQSGGYLGSGGDYVTYGNTIASIVNAYDSLVPVPYGAGGGVVQRLSNGRALALGAGLLTLAALAAYTIHPKPRRALTRRVA